MLKLYISFNYYSFIVVRIIDFTEMCSDENFWDTSRTQLLMKNGFIFSVFSIYRTKVSKDFLIKKLLICIRNISDTLEDRVFLQITHHINFFFMRKYWCTCLRAVYWLRNERFFHEQKFFQEIFLSQKLNKKNEIKRKNYVSIQVWNAFLETAYVTLLLVTHK